MDERLTHDPILTRFRAALDEIYGARPARVVLFGSQARREARPDSDYDVAVFLKRYPTARTELDQLADLRVRFIDHTEDFFDATPHPPPHTETRRRLVYEIRRDGLVL